MILLLIPSACRVRESNQLKASNQVAALSKYETEFEALKRRQFRLQADIDNAGNEIAASKRRRDEAVARLLPVSTELAEKIRLITTMEQDLVAAKKRHAEIEEALAAMADLRQKLAAATKLREGIQAADAEIARHQKTLQEKTATVAGLLQSIKDLADLQARIQKQLGVKPPANKTPPPKKE